MVVARQRGRVTDLPPTQLEVLGYLGKGNNTCQLATP